MSCHGPDGPARGLGPSGVTDTVAECTPAGSFREFEDEIVAWAEAKWPGRPLSRKLRKLGEETGELAEAICVLKALQAYAEALDVDLGMHHEYPAIQDHAKHEVGDVALVLVHILRMIDPEASLPEVMRRVFEKLRQRDDPDETA